MSRAKQAEQILRQMADWLREWSRSGETGRRFAARYQHLFDLSPSSPT